jgi:hypothetical protein
MRVTAIHTHASSAARTAPRPHSDRSGAALLSDGTRSLSADNAPERTPSERTPGVIRLLEAGHFKGVAYVRMRITFLDELARRAAERGADAITSGAPELLERVRSEFESVVSVAGVDEATAAAADELFAGFETAVGQIAEEARSGGDLDADAIDAAFRSAFDSFAEALRELLAPPPAADVDDASSLTPVSSSQLAVVTGGSPPAEDPLASTAAQAPTPVPAADPAEVGGEDLLASLADVFEQALFNLTSLVGDAMRLPDLSPPHGNGAAYTKFLAIYEALRCGLTGSEIDAAA